MDLISLLVGIFLIIVVVSIALAVIRFGFRVVRSLIVNTVLGLIILGVVNLVGVKVPINWITILLSAIAGIPGAIIATILYLIGVI
jgi:hypothetical protein